MKKTIVTTLAMALICAISMACGNKSGKAGDDASADSSLMNEEAVASHVEDVYKYLNDVRHYYTVTPPDKIDYDKWESPDKHFGTQEWIAVRDRVTLSTAKPTRAPTASRRGQIKTTRIQITPGQGYAYDAILPRVHRSLTRLRDHHLISPFAPLVTPVLTSLSPDFYKAMPPLRHGFFS